MESTSDLTAGEAVGGAAPLAAAVTGASGFVGQHLLPQLDRVPGVGRIVGLDIRDPERRVRHLDFHRVDIAHAELKPLVEDVDVVLHLAAIHDPVPDVDLMARVNVEGTRRVLDAAAAVGVRRIVLMSSAAVYGAWPNNPVPLTEEAPLRPNPEFPPGVQAAEVERLLAEWRLDHPGVAVVVLRPAPVLGPGADHLLARIIAAGTVPVRGATAPLQCAHVDDVADALVRACVGDLDGVYNVASDGWADREDARHLQASRRRIPLPEELATRLLTASWTSGVGDVHPGVVPLLVHPWVIANDRLRAAGWSPAHSNEETLVATADELPRPSVWPWVAAGIGAVGAAVIAEELWRRARRSGRG